MVLLADIHMISQPQFLADATAKTLLVDSQCDPSIIALVETCTVSVSQFEHTVFSRAWKPIVSVVIGIYSSFTDGVLHFGQLSALIIVDRASQLYNLFPEKL